MFEHPDDAGFTYSTDTELDYADARQIGQLYPERAWVSTDRDVWHRNPFYQGPPQPHPEDDHAYDDERAADGLATHDHYATHDDVTQPPAAYPHGLNLDDDIPF